MMALIMTVFPETYSLTKVIEKRSFWSPETQRSKVIKELWRKAWWLAWFIDVGNVPLSVVRYTRQFTYDYACPLNEVSISGGLKRRPK